MRRYKSILLTAIYILLVLGFSEVIYLISEETQEHITTSPLILNSTEYGDNHMASISQQLLHRIQVQPFNLIATIMFVLAIIHTFCSHQFSIISEKIRNQNIRLNKVHTDTFPVEFFRFMGEIEVVFGLWVIPLMFTMTMFYDWTVVLHYLNSVSYNEAIFVVIIMALSATRPILQLAENILAWISKLGGSTVTAWWLSILILGPLFGSFITEPAAMTICALLLGRQFYCLHPSKALSYGTLGLLFTNVSVGGVLTNYAAPPILMVIARWDWTTSFMMHNFGLKAIVGIIISTGLYYLFFRKELKELEAKKENNDQLNLLGKPKSSNGVPFGISLLHVAFLAWAVVHIHYPVIFVGTFLLFLGFYRATQPYQHELELKTPVLVGFFLAGLVVHGNLQGWWITPILERTSEGVLMLMTVTLTAFNDNAEVTFLSTLIPNFPDTMKYVVVAGAMTGGGLTVIANAPNLVGQALLSRYFGRGVSALYLFYGAFIPTIIMGVIFYFTRPI